MTQSWVDARKELYERNAMTPTLDRPINGYEQLYRKLEAENKRLRELLVKAISAIDVDNLTTQTLYRELSQALEATQ